MSFAQDPARLAALGRWIAGQLGLPSVRPDEARLLPGGAIQENWHLTCRLGDGPDAPVRRFVLRRNATAGIGSSRPLAQEFAVLSAAHAAGVLVPAPLGYCDDPTILGSGFVLMEAVEGVGLGPRIVKDRALGGDRDGACRAARQGACQDPHDPPAAASPGLSRRAAGRSGAGCHREPAPDARPAGCRATGPGMGIALGGAACARLRGTRAGPRRLPHRELSRRPAWPDRDPRLGVRRVGRPDGGPGLVLCRVLALRAPGSRGRRHRRPRSISTPATRPVVVRWTTPRSGIGSLSPISVGR